MNDPVLTSSIMAYRGLVPLAAVAINYLLNIRDQSARVSKITNDGLTRYADTGCSVAEPSWQQRESKG